MRLLRLLGAAAQAESLLLRRQGASMGRSAVLRGVAVAFGAVSVVMLHVGGWIWLKEEYGALNAALILAAANAVMMLLLLWMARERHDPIAAEALRLRDQSLAQISAPRGPTFESLALRVGSGLVMNMLRR